MRLVMLGQVCFLPKTLSAQTARERFFPGMSPDVDVHRVFILEAFGADAAVVQRPLFSHPVARGSGVLDGGLSFGAAVCATFVLLRWRFGAGDSWRRRCDLDRRI